MAIHINDFERLYSGSLQLICTVTPASSNSEETHNTLKFAHRSKQVEIKASQNKVNLRINMLITVTICSMAASSGFFFFFWECFICRFWMRSLS